MTVPEPTGTAVDARFAASAGADSASAHEHAEVTAAEEPMTAAVRASPAVLITPRRDGFTGALRRTVSGLFGLVSIGICSFSRVRTIHHADTRSWISGFQRTIARSEEHTSELQSRFDLVCRLLLEKKK